MRWERNSLSLTGYLTLLGVMTILSLHSGCHRKLESPIESLQLASEDFRRGEFDAAVKRLEVVVDQVPSNPEAWATLALSYACQHREALAIEALNRAAESGFRHPELIELEPCMKAIRARASVAPVLARMQESNALWLQRLKTVHRIVAPPVAGSSFRSLEELNGYWYEFVARERPEALGRGADAFELWRFEKLDQKLALLRSFLESNTPSVDREAAAKEVIATALTYRGDPTLASSWGDVSELLSDSSAGFITSYPGSASRPFAEYAHAVAVWVSGDRSTESGASQQEKLQHTISAFDLVAKKFAGTSDGCNAQAWEVALQWVDAGQRVTPEIRSKNERLVRDCAGQTAIDLPERLAPLLGYQLGHVQFPGAVDMDGHRWTSEELRGHVLLLQFWATWCAPCRSEMPVIRRLSALSHSEPLVVLGVSLDEMDVEKFRSWIAARDIDWPQILDKQQGASQLASAYGVGPVPFHVVIDREGNIVAAGVEVREIERVVIDELRDQGAGARLQPERLSADAADR